MGYQPGLIERKPHDYWLSQSTLMQTPSNGWIYAIDIKSHTSIHPYIHKTIHPSIHTDRQTYRHTDIHTYRHTDIQKYRHTKIQTYRHTDIKTYIHTDRQTHTHTHTYIHTYIHTYMHTYIHTYIHTCIHTYIHTTLWLPWIVWKVSLAPQSGFYVEVRQVIGTPLLWESLAGGQGFISWPLLVQGFLQEED